LVGLKENVIVGRLIPAGTGRATQEIKRVAQSRDAQVIADRRAEAALVNNAIESAATNEGSSDQAFD